MVMAAPVAIHGQDASPTASATAIQLANLRELFIDNYLIDSLEGLSLKLHEPKPTPPITEPANDMEYGTIIRDGELFSMYTRDGR